MFRDQGRAHNIKQLKAAIKGGNVEAFAELISSGSVSTADGVAMLYHSKDRLSFYKFRGTEYKDVDPAASFAMAQLLVESKKAELDSNPELKNDLQALIMMLAIQYLSEEHAIEYIQSQITAGVKVTDMRFGLAAEPILSHAIRWAKPAVATFLLENGADVNASNSEGKTALHLLASTSLSLYEYMIINRRERAFTSSIMTPYYSTFGMADFSLWGLTTANDEMLKSLTQLLVSQGADVNAQDALGRTPLHDAIHIYTRVGSLSYPLMVNALTAANASYSIPAKYTGPVVVSKLFGEIPGDSPADIYVRWVNTAVGHETQKNLEAIYDRYLLALNYGIVINTSEEIEAFRKDFAYDLPIPTFKFEQYFEHAKMHAKIISASQVGYNIVQSAQDEVTPAINRQKYSRVRDILPALPGSMKESESFSSDPLDLPSTPRSSIIAGEEDPRTPSSPKQLLDTGYFNAEKYCSEATKPAEKLASAVISRPEPRTPFVFAQAAISKKAQDYTVPSKLEY